MVTYLMTLYHSPVTGQICCLTHAPKWAADAWKRDRWLRVTLRDREEWRMAELGEIQCLTCKVIERMRAAETDVR